MEEAASRKHAWSAETCLELRAERSIPLTDSDTSRNNVAGQVGVAVGVKVVGLFVGCFEGGIG